MLKLWSEFILGTSAVCLVFAVLCVLDKIIARKL